MSIKKEDIDKVLQVNTNTGFEILSINNNNKIQLNNKCEINWYVLQGKVVNVVLSKKKIWTENDLYRFFLHYSFGFKYEYTFNSFELFRNEYSYNDLSLKDGVNFLFININSWSQVQTDLIIIPLNRYNYKHVPFGIVKYFPQKSLEINNIKYKRNIVKSLIFDNNQKGINGKVWIEKNININFAYNYIKNSKLYNFWLNINKIKSDLWYKKYYWVNLYKPKKRTILGYSIYMFFDEYSGKKLEQDWTKHNNDICKYKFIHKKLTLNFLAGVFKIFLNFKRKKILRCDGGLYVIKKKIRLWSKKLKKKYNLVYFDKDFVYLNLKKYRVYNNNDIKKIVNYKKVLKKKIKDDITYKKIKSKRSKKRYIKKWNKDKLKLTNRLKKCIPRIKYKYKESKKDMYIKRDLCNNSVNIYDLIKNNYIKNYIKKIKEFSSKQKNRANKVLMGKKKPHLIIKNWWFNLDYNNIYLYIFKIIIVKRINLIQLKKYNVILKLLYLKLFYLYWKNYFKYIRR